MQALPTDDACADDEEHEPEADAPQQDTTVIVAVCENRRFEIGIASMDLRTFSIDLAGFADDQAFSKALGVLAVAEPHQLLFPSTAKDSVRRTSERARYTDPPRRSAHLSRARTRAARRVMQGPRQDHQGRLPTRARWLCATACVERR